MQAIRTVLYALGFVLICAITFFAAMPAHATGRIEAVPGDADTITSNASASASAQGGAASVSGVQVGGGNGGSGGSMSSRMVALPGGAFAAGALPATWCVQSKQTYRKRLFGFWEDYDAESITDFECLKLLAQLGAMQSSPPPQPASYLVLPPMTREEVCALPAAQTATKPKRPVAVSGGVCR